MEKKLFLKGIVKGKKKGKEKEKSIENLSFFPLYTKQSSVWTRNGLENNGEENRKIK